MTADEKLAAVTALNVWAGAKDDERERVTNILDVVMEAADDRSGPLLVVARDILDAAADGELRVARADEEDLVAAATDVPPSKAVSLLFLVIAVQPESDVVAAGELLEKLAAIWTYQERRAVCDWAAALHVNASDNPDVRIPTRPTVLDAVLEPPAGRLRTSLPIVRRALVQRLAESACGALRALAWVDARCSKELLAEADTIERRAWTNHSARIEGSAAR